MKNSVIKIAQEQPKKKMCLFNGSSLTIDADNQIEEFPPIGYYDTINKYVDFIHQKANKSKNIFSRMWDNLEYTYFSIKACLMPLSSESIEVKNNIIKKINNKFETLYPDMSKLIEESLIAAKAQNKPVLILIGDTHTNLSPSFMESFILYLIAKSNSFYLKNIFTESFEAKYYGCKSYSASTHNIIEKQIESLGLNKIPIDLALCKQWDNFPEALNVIDYDQIMSGFIMDEGRTKKDIQKKNQVMSDIMQGFKSEGNAVAIVGCAHLHGLMKETDLQEHYYVVPINVCPFKLKKLMDELMEEMDSFNEIDVEYDKMTTLFFRKSPEIKKYTCPLERAEYFGQYYFSAHEILDASQNAYTKLVTNLYSKSEKVNQSTDNIESDSQLYPTFWC